MRKRHSDSGADEAAIDLTPMLDIVFIMLIFFIVTTSFVKESGVEINRPSASTAETVKKGNIMVAVAKTARSGSTNGSSKWAPCVPTSSGCERRIRRAPW